MKTIFNYLLLNILIAQTAFATETQVFLQTDGQERINTTAMDSGDGIAFYAVAGRSYCCSVYKAHVTNFVDPSFPRFSDLKQIVVNSSTIIPFTARGTADPGIFLANNHPAPENARGCFTATISNRHIFAVTLSGNDVTNIASSCTETTLFGGFNTSVTDFNFLEIRNVSNVSVTGKISAFDSVSNQQVINDREFTVEAGRRLDVDIHSLTGPSKFGPVTLSHDGPPGSLQAQVSQYNLTSSSPLEIIPVAVEVLKPRH